MQSLVTSYRRALAGAGKLSPLMMLIARLQMAHVFWVSGMLKVSDWGNTLELFSYEHPVPGLPPSPTRRPTRAPPPRRGPRPSPNSPETAPRT